MVGRTSDDVYPLTKSYGLTPKAVEFVQSMAKLGDVVAAEKAVGLSTGYGYSLIRQPLVQSALAAELRRHLTIGAPLALQTLLWACEKSTSDRVRVDAAKAILDRAGFVAPRATLQDPKAEKALTEMSLEELKTLAARLEDELAGRARPVNAPPGDAAPSQASDLLD